ncbi:DUF2607 family protein [Thalassotalea piscium]|uniref:Uncharacterized protein n=1 Tax=Thalassotalea piscium TaxID=1230533 RepID=A0A7X0NI28_9GAMM|nr:DUF2607 family protein [Thalassotalea piscium]MBB6543879.1 hypothetical protein [Thalassotalea piscium]
MSTLKLKLIPKYRLTSLFMLVFLLFFSLGHAHTIDVTKSNVEQQECNLCQHNIGSIPQRLTVTPVEISEFTQPSTIDNIKHATKTDYFSPQLRAPPTHT